MSLVCQVYLSDLGDHGAHVPDRVLRSGQQNYEGGHRAILLVPVCRQRVLLCR